MQNMQTFACIFDLVFPQHLKYAVGRRAALPGVLSRRTLTLSLVMRELPSFKAALRWKGEGANI